MKLAKLDFNYISNSCNNVNNSSNTANEEEIVLSVLQSSTILAINSPILKKDQIELLLSHIRINQSNSSCSDAMMMDVDGEAKTGDKKNSSICLTL